MARKSKSKRNVASRLKVVLIEWADSSTIGTDRAWNSKEDMLLAAKFVPIIHTAGILLKADKQQYVLAQSIDAQIAPPSVSNCFTIPKGCVRRVKVLR